MKLIEIFGKVLAKCASPAKGLQEPAMAALASVAEFLLQVCDATLVRDVRRLKSALFRRIDARTSIEVSEAKAKLAEASQDANKVTAKVFEESLRLIERDRALIENCKRRAEAEIAEARADKAKAEAADRSIRTMRSMLGLLKEMRQTRIEEAQIELFSALGQLSQEGGALHIDSKNLMELIALSEKVKAGKEIPQGGIIKRKPKHAE